MSTKLRENIYQLLDHVLETGQVLEVRRRGQILRIIPEVPESRLERLKQRPTIRGNAGDLVGIDWSGEWSGELKP